MHADSMRNLVIIFFILLLAFPFPGFAQNKQAGLYLEKGNEFYKARNIDSALYYYDRAVKADNDCAETYYRRALAKEKTQDIDGAIADYQAAIRISPMPVYYNNLGMIMTMRGQQEEAIEQFDLALAIDSTYVQSLFNKGISYHHLGNVEEACKYVGKARQQGLLFADEYLSQFCK
jgi:tetratricopeptide (TPR) repeat protein